MSAHDVAPVRRAAEALKTAIDRHLEACATRSGEADPQVQAAYDELRLEAERYDDVLFETLGEVTPFEFPPVVATGDGGGMDEDSPRRVGLYLRRDYLVNDVEELLAAAGSATAQSRPEEAGPPAVEEPTTAGRAVYQLLHARGVDGLDELAEDSGLVPVGGTMWVLVEDEDADNLYDEPFADVDPDRLLYRLDEIFEG